MLVSKGGIVKLWFSQLTHGLNFVKLMQKNDLFVRYSSFINRK